MTSPVALPADPLDFVASALDGLPAQPADVTRRDLAAIEAACQGLARIAAAIHRETGSADRQFKALMKRRDALLDIAERCQRAERQLTAYVAPALTVLGQNRRHPPTPSRRRAP